MAPQVLVPFLNWNILNLPALRSIGLSLDAVSPTYWLDDGA